MFTTIKRYYSRTAPVFIPGNYFGDGSDGISTTGSNFIVNASGDMVVANYTSVNVGATGGFGVSAPCKGMLIYCQGDFVLSGSINMQGNSYVGTGSTDATLFRFVDSGSVQSAANISIMGTSASVAENIMSQVYNWYNDGITYTIQNSGSAGGLNGNSSGIPFSRRGLAGTSNNNGCGGGGGGSFYSVDYPTDYSTPGSSGSYSGGGKGGTADGDTGSGPAGGNGGGNIILIVKGNVIITSSGIISAKGNNGVNGSDLGTRYGGSGGGGGGTICILYGGTYINSGSVTANGGTGGLASAQVFTSGGNGGNGNIYIQKIRSN